MIILSLLYRWCSINSGSALVPALMPALSPKDRVIANPGIKTSFIHTRSGPSYSPVSLFWANTLPPFFMILSFSSYRSGFWSTDRGITVHSCSPLIFMVLICGNLALFSSSLFKPVSRCLRRMALESPTLNTRNFSSYTKTATSVLPANSVLISDSNSCWLVFCNAR